MQFKFGELANGGTGRDRTRCAAPINSVLMTEQETCLIGSFSRNSSKDTEHARPNPEPSTEDQIIMCSPAELTTLQ